MKLLTISEWYKQYPEETTDLSFHKQFTCVNHQGMVYSSKNPTCRSIFIRLTDESIVRANTTDEELEEIASNPEVMEQYRRFFGLDCECPISDLRYIDAHPEKKEGVKMSHRIPTNDQAESMINRRKQLGKLTKPALAQMHVNNGGQMGYSTYLKWTKEELVNIVIEDEFGSGAAFKTE